MSNISRINIAGATRASPYTNIKPNFLAEAIIAIPKELKKKNNIEINNAFYENELCLLEKLNSDDITKSVFSEILADMCKGKKIDFSKYKGMSDSELEKELKKIISENKGAPFGALMGIAMNKFKGRVDGKKLSEMLRKLSN